MRSKQLFILILLSLPLRSFAQFQQNIPQVKPLSPDVTAMFKVLEKPVGSFTGTVPVSFPLMSLSAGPLQVGLSLSYSTGGIRVEEIASSVGLGFSLADGAGRIVQTINGLPDDFAFGILDSRRNLSTFSCSNMQNIWLSTVPYQYDLEPDAFLYNFNGRSGKFFFKQNGAIIISENAGIKIEYDTVNIGSSGIHQFIITDEKGNKYYFGQNKSKTINYTANSTYEYQTVGNPSNSNPGVSNHSWYLTEVYDMNEENSLKYTYVSQGDQTTTFSGGFYKSWTFGSCTGFNVAPGEATVVTTTDEYLVSKIDGGSSGYILVNSAADRLDGTYLRKVNNLELYDSTGVFKKRIKFNYGYFNAGEGDPFMRRLKLVTFSEFGSSSTDSISHKFTYNETTNLPSRLSNSVDLWGYYNGKYNTSHFPNLYYKYGSYVIRAVKDANRSAVPIYAQADILTKITYPTGGYRQFVYEGNQALMSTLNEHFMDDNYTASQSFSRTNFNTYTNPIPCMIHIFTINSTDGGANFSYTLSPGTCGSYIIKLFLLTSPTDSIGGSLLYTENNVSSWSYDLPNGYYRIEAYKLSSSCSFSALSGNWKESTLSTATITTPVGGFNRNNINAGGLRIKQLIDYDPVTNQTSTTEYKYKLYSTDSTFTSGVLISPVHMVSMENPGSWDGRFLAVHTTSCYPLANEGGSYVVYPEVRTIQYGNGYSDRKFSFQADFNYSYYPAVPPADYSYARGNLQSERYYDLSGNLLRKVVYGYVYGNGAGSQIGYRHKPYYHDAQDNGGQDREQPRDENEWPVHADCNSYFANLTSTLPYSTLDSVYSSTGALVTQTVNSYYNYNSQLILSKVRTTINNGDAREVTCKYPFTANASYSLFLNATEQTMKSNLLSRNCLTPLEVIDSLKPLSGTASFIGGKKYIFDVFNSADYHLSQVRTYTTLSDSTVNRFTNYDLKGNLREQDRVNDIKEVYIWGYRGQYPVAKITNSNYLADSTLIAGANLWAPVNDATLRSQLNNLRTGLVNSKAMVTTYTYLPLIGITSETDPSGKTIYYEYDSLGRLVLIRDQNNNIVKKIEYKLAGAL